MNEFIFSLIEARIRNEVICTLILILICVRNSNNGFVYAVVYLKLIVYTIANAICDIVFFVFIINMEVHVRSSSVITNGA